MHRRVVTCVCICSRLKTIYRTDVVRIMYGHAEGTSMIVIARLPRGQLGFDDHTRHGVNNLGYKLEIRRAEQYVLYSDFRRTTRANSLPPNKQSASGILE